VYAPTLLRVSASGVPSELPRDEAEVVAEHEQSEEHDREHDANRQGPRHALGSAAIGDEEVKRRKQASDDEHQEQYDQDFHALQAYTPANLPARFHFQPRLVTTLAAVAAIAVTLALAHWQLGRAHEKEALAARLQSLAKDAAVTLSSAQARVEDVEWRRVTAHGRFDPRHGVLIDNRIHHGVAGYHVVMPLAMEGGRFVLVNRGWVAGNADRSRLPEVRTPADPVEITGLAVVPGRRFLELSDQVAEGRVWQNLTLERYRRAVPIPLQPVMIQQENTLADGLVREWDPPNVGIDKHYGYAFQWLAIGVTILGFYLATHVKRGS
jgi:surfeit locus 1 family protein